MLFVSIFIVLYNESLTIFSLLYTPSLSTGCSVGVMKVYFIILEHFSKKISLIISKICWFQVKFYFTHFNFCILFRAENIILLPD